MDSSVDPRQLRRMFQSVTSRERRFNSPEELLCTYTAPFIQIFSESALPATLKTPSLLSPPPLSSSASASPFQSSRQEIDVLLVESVQASLLNCIVVDWNHSLEPTLLRDLLETWFFAPSADLSTTSSQQGTLQLCALRTITSVLSTPDQHSLTLETVEQLCTAALSHLSLPALINAVVTNSNKARADVVWGEALRFTCSLPDRLANATLGKMPEGFSLNTWIEQVLVGGVATTLDSQVLTHQKIKLLKDVLIRLNRIGYLSRTIDAEHRGFWPSLLAFSLQSKRVVEAWPKLRSILSRQLRLKLDIGLIGSLQYLLATKGYATGLVTEQERTRAGSEGTAFLGKLSHRAVAATAQVLGAFLKSAQNKDAASGSDSVSDSDEEDTTTSTVKVFKSVALSHSIEQIPLLALAWATYLSNNLAPSELLTCLEMTLDVWADTTRIKRSILGEQRFLTTLISCLLASISISTTPTSKSGIYSASSTRGTKERFETIARSRAILDGVSAHLEHTDATTRRLGMLVAELLSAKTVDVNEGKGKALNFGRGMWDGVGGGKEECRVLRALSDAWMYHSAAIEDVMRQWKENDIVQAIQLLSITSDHEKDKKEGLKQVATVKKVRSSGPKTRCLPRKVEPPARGNTKIRPLITMLGSDNELEPEQDDTQPVPLKMFSTTRRQEHPSWSDSSESSSDELDSDDADGGNDPNEIQRLAAELSGLSSGEAGNILKGTSLDNSSTKSFRTKSKRRPTGDVFDFDQDKESHAPQFNKKLSIPVYVSQLGPMLKSSDRASIRLALRHAATLIRRKSLRKTYGNEVSENAVDLTLCFCALHDNYGIKDFDRMRREALTSLAVGAPVTVVEVMAEQCFGSQYTNAQRTAMWASIVESALELSGKKKRDHVGIKGEQGGREADKVGRVADGVVNGVIENAKRIGEDRVPAIRREKNLSISASTRSIGDRSTRALVQVLDGSSSSSSSIMTQRDHSGNGDDNLQMWTKIAGPTYLFPLINRFLAYQNHFSTRNFSTYLGTGTAAMFSPETLAVFLDTLTILISLVSSHLLSELTPSLLEVACTLLKPSSINMSASWIGASASVHTASMLNLLAVIIHLNLEWDHAESLIKNSKSVTRLRSLLSVIQHLFTVLQEKHSYASGDAKNAGGVRLKILSRAATILLLMDTIDSIRIEVVRRMIGFVPL